MHKPSLFQSGFNTFTPSPIITSRTSKSPEEKISFSLIKPQLLPCTPACCYKFHALAVYLHSTLTAHPIRDAMESSRTSAVELYFRNSQRVKTVGYFRRRAPSWMFNRILKATLPNNYLPLQEKLATFPGMLGDILQTVWQHSPEFLMTFPGIFGDIPQNVW